MLSQPPGRAPNNSEKWRKKSETIPENVPINEKVSRNKPRQGGKKGSKDFHMPCRDVTESIKRRLWALSVKNSALFILCKLSV